LTSTEFCENWCCRHRFLYEVCISPLNPSRFPMGGGCIYCIEAAILPPADDGR
jgi:hypothetical protein